MNVPLDGSIFAQSLPSVHLDPRSLLGLTTLVAAFLSSSKRGSYAWYKGWSPGTLSSDRDIAMLATCTGVSHTASAVR